MVTTADATDAIHDEESVGVRGCECDWEGGVEGLLDEMGVVSRGAAGICCWGVSCCVGDCVLKRGEADVR